MQFIPLIAIMLIMWALLIVPQQRRAKAHRLMLSELGVGDEILTSSGLYGAVAEFDGQTVFIEIADGVEVKVTRDSIAERIVYQDSSA